MMPEGRWLVPARNFQPADAGTIITLVAGSPATICSGTVRAWRWRKWLQPSRTSRRAGTIILCQTADFIMRGMKYTAVLVVEQKLRDHWTRPRPRSCSDG